MKKFKVGRGAVRRVMSASLLVALLATLYGSAPASAADTQCTGTIGAETVDQVVVPDGETCELQGTTVNQNVIIGVGSDLLTLNAQVGGNIQGTNGPRLVRILETDVQGDIQLKGATRQITIGDANCRIDPYVGGNIQLEENRGGIAICRVEVREDLQLFKNTGRIGVRHNEVGENMQIADNNGRRRIIVRYNDVGENLQIAKNTADELRVTHNKVGTAGSGNLELTENLTGYTWLARNKVADNLDCSGNDVAPKGKLNSAVAKNDQCFGL